MFSQLGGFPGDRNLWVRAPERKELGQDGTSGTWAEVTCKSSLCVMGNSCVTMTSPAAGSSRPSQRHRDLAAQHTQGEALHLYPRPKGHRESQALGAGL